MSGIDGTCVLRARGLRKQYGREGGLVRAVDGVDLDVAARANAAASRTEAAARPRQLGLIP